MTRAELLTAIQADVPSLAVFIAQGWAKLGVRETARNRGMWVDAIVELAGSDKEPAYEWCAMFVEACWRQAGLCALRQIDDRKVHWGGSVHTNWVRTFQRNPAACIWAKDAAANPSLVQPGDALMRFELVVPERGYVIGNAKNGHTEIVSHVHPDGFVDTIGGNTTSGDSRAGNGVFHKVRSYSMNEARVVGFIRPAFALMESA